MNIVSVATLELAMRQLKKLQKKIVKIESLYHQSKTPFKMSLQL